MGYIPYVISQETCRVFVRCDTPGEGGCSRFFAVAVAYRPKGWLGEPCSNSGSR